MTIEDIWRNFKITCSELSSRSLVSRTQGYIEVYGTHNEDPEQIHEVCPVKASVIVDYDKKIEVSESHIYGTDLCVAIVTQDGQILESSVRRAYLLPRLYGVIEYMRVYDWAFVSNELERTIKSCKRSNVNDPCAPVGVKAVKVYWGDVVCEFEASIVRAHDSCEWYE